MTMSVQLPLVSLVHWAVMSLPTLTTVVLSGDVGEAWAATCETEARAARAKVAEAKSMSAGGKERSGASGDKEGEEEG